MPLLDHFHPPLSQLRHWEAFHAAWATEIMRTLNRKVLPARCFAEAQVHIGGRVEVDVATFDRGSDTTAPRGNGEGGVAVETWAPPATDLVMPSVFPDEIEVQVFESTAGPTLVAAIELVSPSNKDRPDSRRAFVTKCASYLHLGVGLIVVDVVTERLANLHDELIRLMEKPARFAFPAAAPPLYVAAYRPARREGRDEIDIWREPLKLGAPLPTMPLALRGLTTVPLDLESTYDTTCQDSRISP
jgi:hypothetical protein